MFILYSVKYHTVAPKKSKLKEQSEQCVHALKNIFISNVALETEWENEMTVFVCPFFVSRMPLFMHHCPHHDACIFTKAKKIHSLHLLLLSPSFSQSKSP